MSMNFSAHQYDAAFRPNRLRNWEVPKIFAVPASKRECYPEFVADEKGHLFPEYKCSNRHPFCTYIGTYSLPRRITKDLAVKLSKFPRKHYSVIKDTIYKPCKIAKICERPGKQQELRPRIRQCIEDNIDENMKEDISKIKNESFVRKVKECMDVNSPTTDDAERNQLLRKMVRDCIKENTNGSIENINKEILFKAVKECLRKKQGQEGDNGDSVDTIRKIVKQCMENQLKGKDILEANKQELKQNIKDCVAGNLESSITPMTSPDDTKHRNMIKSEPEKDITRDREENLRQKVKDCINQLDPSQVSKTNLKDKIKQCVNKNKESDTTETNEELRNIVRKCMKEIDNDKTDPRNMKQKIKDCVKKNKRQTGDKEPNNENEIRRKVNQCIAKVASEEGNPSTESRKQDFKQKVKKCLEEQDKPEEQGKENMMRDAVKHCLEQYKTSDNRLDKAELKDKIKRCAQDEVNFRQAVKECIPRHIGEKNFKEKVKECAQAKVKDKTEAKVDDKHQERGKENMMRDAVKHCLDQYTTADIRLDKAELKDKIKRCAQEEVNFRQAVRECIPGNIGEKNFKEKVKKCAEAKVKDKTEARVDGKGDVYRDAVQECIKEKRNVKKDILPNEFKKVVKDCALKKLKKY